MQYQVEFELVDENIIGTNSPTFRSRVRIEGLEAGIGFGYSKKESQQIAAKEAMRHIRKKTDLYKNIIEAHEARTVPITSEESDNIDENMRENEAGTLEITEQV